MAAMIYRYLLLLLSVYALSTTARADAWLIEVDGAIGPSIADHFVRGLEQAEAANAELVIMRIDTPGGLDTAMREMIKAMLATPLPVVAYVAPGGARAASAGTYLLYAASVAAMAPGTNLGAATPVQMGKPELPQFGKERTAEDPATGESSAPQPATAMEHKIVNDAVAYIQSLAQLRGRNARWAEQAVRDGASLSANAALKQGVIEIIASSIPDLLVQLDGREVPAGQGTVVLNTADLAVYQHPVDWRSEFLAVITDPNVAYILMLVGVYGLLLEFYNPGGGLPGITGAICLLLALYAFQTLPVSYAGLGLILLGIALMTAEAFSPSFGVLGLGGLVAFVVGSVLLMDTEMPAYQIALPVILGVSVFSAVLLVLGVGLMMRARQRPVRNGLDHLVGATAEVEAVPGGVPRVNLDGELWTVACEDSLAPHDRVTVESIDGLTLHVSKHKEG
ncbi:MAG: nodulation protein NfeD [Halioglobus sp.]|nr:nodulation protein NfeD [Halioglobus sp.]